MFTPWDEVVLLIVMFDVGQLLLGDVSQVEKGILVRLVMIKVETPAPGPLPLCVAVLGVQCMGRGIDGTADHSKKNQILLRM